MQHDDSVQRPCNGLDADGAVRPERPGGRIAARLALGRDSLHHPETAPSHGFARVGTPLRIRSDTDQSP